MWAASEYMMGSICLEHNHTHIRIHPVGSVNTYSVNSRLVYLNKLRVWKICLWWNQEGLLHKINYGERGDLQLCVRCLISLQFRAAIFFPNLLIKCSIVLQGLWYEITCLITKHIIPPSSGLCTMVHVCARVCVIPCLCLCVCERERETEGELTSPCYRTTLLSIEALAALSMGYWWKQGRQKL